MSNKRVVLEIFALVLTLSMLSGLVDAVGATPQAAEPLFSLKLIAPTSNPVRMQYAQLMEQELPKIGIDAELDLISWAALGPRATDQEVGPYAQGGYDIVFFGMSLGSPSSHPGDSMQAVYGGSAIPPAGFNVMYWSDAKEEYMNYRADESDALIQQINSELNLTKSRDYLYDWQKIWYDVMPNVVIYNQYEVHCVSKGLYGYDPVGYPFSSLETQWLADDYPGTADTVILAASTAGDSFNTLIATDVYDQYSAGPPMDGLVGHTPSNEMLLPTGTDRETWMNEHYHDIYGTSGYLEIYPRVAKALGNFSDDGLKYTIEIRDDVFFHDGHQVDAWDVVMSYQAALIPDIGASVYSNLLLPFGVDDMANHHGNYSFQAVDKDSDGFYETVEFYFNNTFAPFITDYLGMAIFPEHILGDPVNHGYDSDGTFNPDAHWLVKPADWREHSFNTGNPGDPGGLKGPIGCGSVVFKGIDSETGTIELQKFDGIKWDNTTGDWVDDANTKHYLVADGRLDDMPTTAKIIVASSTGAIADAKTGKVNILDPQFTLANIYSELQQETNVNPILSTETGWQSIYFNPKFTVKTQLGDNDRPLNRKGVRHAVSHVVPRDDIITYLMNGLGVPAYTPVPVTSWGAIPKDQMLAYKRTVEAADGSTIEADATTAYDVYSLDLAFEWLESEGYDVTAIKEGAETTAPTGGTTPGFEALIFLTSIIGTVLILRRRMR